MECHRKRLSILMSNVLFSESFLGVAWHLFRIKMAHRKSCTREFKLSVTLENGKHLQESLMWIENTLEIGLSKKKV